MPPMRDPYQIVTDKIVEALEAGVVPWRRPWNLRAAPHQNLATRRRYSGVNVLLLNATAAVRSYSSPYWLTLRQANNLGGRIRKGERGTTVVYWTFLEREVRDSDGRAVLDDAGEPLLERTPFLRTYTVFNVEQCDLPAGKVPSAATAGEATILPDAERIWEAYSDRPPLVHGGDHAYYRIDLDVIHLPERGAFLSTSGYYGTLFHEAVHSTGVPKRLNRRTLTGVRSPGDESYSQEELVAEIGSALLLASAGLEPEYENHAAYLRGWLQALRGDRRLIVVAAAQAEKAARYILGENERGEEAAASVPLAQGVPA